MTSHDITTLTDEDVWLGALADAVLFGDASVREYCDVMVAEYDEQEQHFAARVSAEPTSRGAGMCWATARAKRDAYADVLRLLDIATDSAARRVARRISADA